MVVSPRVVTALEKIGLIKNALPRYAKGDVNRFGLFVQLREMNGMARLQAGGRFRSSIDLWRDAVGKPWSLKKYRPGEWEAQVEPTLEQSIRLSPTNVAYRDHHVQLSGLAGKAIGQAFGPVLQEPLSAEWVSRFGNTVCDYGTPNSLVAGREIIDVLREELALVHNYVFDLQLKLALCDTSDSPLLWETLAKTLEGHRQRLSAFHRAQELAPNDSCTNLQVAMLYFFAAVFAPADARRQRERYDAFPEYTRYMCSPRDLGCNKHEARVKAELYARAAASGTGKCADDATHVIEKLDELR